MCSVVIIDCVHLIKTYKRLDYEDRQRVRNPLHASSYPEFGKEWDLYAAELYSAHDNFQLLKLKVHGIWRVVGKTDEPPVMRLKDSAVMLNVIEALEDLEVKLKDSKK